MFRIKAFEGDSPTDRREWHRRVWRLAGPIILANLSVPLVGIVDTAVVGHLAEPAYIGAVALGALIFSFLYWGFGFLRMGTTGFVAQAFGVDNYAEVRAIVVRSLILSTGLGLAIIAVQWPVAQLAFGLLEGSARVERLAETYFFIRVYSAPATLTQYVVLGALIGLHRARATLVIQLLLNGTNIVLDIAFVAGLHWGVAGVAWASLISEYLAAAVGLWLLFDARLRGAVRLRTVMALAEFTSLLRVNADIFIRTLCLVFSFSYFTAISTRLGEVTLAANAVLMHMHQLTAYSLDGFAHSAEALTGSGYGSRDRVRFRSAVRYSTLWAAIFAAGYTIVYALFGSGFVALMTDLEAVRETAAIYLPWVIAMPLISVWSFQLDGIFIGTTRTAEMRNGMLISAGAFLGATALFVEPWGNHGLWLSLVVLMIARSLTLGFWYPRIDARFADS